MLRQVLGRAAAAGTSLKVLDRGRDHPAATRRGRWPGIGRARCAQWGTGPAGGFAALALRAPHQVGIIDELGVADVRRAAPALQRLARALADLGVSEGDGVAVMCRNHRGFVDASVAVAKLGADILYLNTAFAGPQLVDVLEREQPTRRRSTTRSSPTCSPRPTIEHRVVAWTDGDVDGRHRSRR